MKPEEVAFQRTVLDYYAQHGRQGLPWRLPEKDGSFDAYKILVSEVMLQQTQAPRVIPKFQEFTGQFPTSASLAVAPLADVLRAWSGLGYNRRAKFLWQAANVIARTHAGRVPHEHEALVLLPGIGANTAGAILAYAYNQPAIFIETNIRTVFIYHFFKGQAVVADKDIAAVVARTLPQDARTWYWALMDYGTYLKQTVGNLTKASAVYAKQSTFKGSRRQVRGQVLQCLHEQPLSLTDMRAVIRDARLPDVLDDLIGEGFIHMRHDKYVLGSVL